MAYKAFALNEPCRQSGARANMTASLQFGAINAAVSDEIRVAADGRYPIYKLFRRENFYFWGFLLKINGLIFAQRRIRGALCTARLCPARILAASAQASVA